MFSGSTMGSGTDDYYVALQRFGAEEGENVVSKSGDVATFGGVHGVNEIDASAAL